MSEYSKSMQQRWIDVAGGQLRVRHTGSGTPVLLVAGAFQSGHLWDGVVDELVDDGGIELIVPDLPLGGHQRPMESDADLSFPAVGERVITILDELGHDRVVVVANDSGGALTQYLITTHPDRFSGVLLTSVDAYDNFTPKYFRYILPPLRFRLPLWGMAQLCRMHWARSLPITFGHLIKTRLDDEQATALLGQLWKSPGSRRDIRRAMVALDGNLTVEAAKHFDRFTGPVDIAWTEHDRIFPDEHADRLAADFPNGRRVADITDSGSISPADQPVQVADRVRDLLARVGSAPMSRVQGS